MNMELIRKQLAEMTAPDMPLKQQVLHQIQIRRHNRKRHIQLSAAAVLFVVIMGVLQFQQLAAMAENIYRSIQISFQNETLVIDNNLEMIPIEVNGLTQVGKQPNRVGYKSYTGINAAENELKIKLLPNTMSNESPVDFRYFEKRKVAELLLRDIFTGDLKNFNVTILENGDRQSRYHADQDSVYKSPVSMKVLFFTGRGAEYEMDNLDTYSYVEKYISPVNGIAAYLLKDTFQATSEENSLLMYAAGGITERVTVFVHNNLFYTIYGNIPSSEMKKIIDAFVIET